MSAAAQVPISPPLGKRAASIPNIEEIPTTKNLRVLTWNVAALRTIPSKIGSSEFQSSIPRTKVLKAFFDKYNVDIACLQEHKFSGWDKVDQEYACVEGIHSNNRALHQDSTRSGHSLVVVMLAWSRTLGPA
jgi:mRNA deadenylase 3'-5' endonuclease subunit Ccr4